MHEEWDVSSDKDENGTDPASHYPDVGKFGDLTDSIGSATWGRQLMIFMIGLVGITYMTSLLLASPDLIADNADLVPAEPTTIADTLKEEESTTFVSVLAETSRPKTIIATQSQQVIELKRGQTMIEALKKVGVPSSEAYSALATLGEEVDMRRVLPGQEIHVVWGTGDDKPFEGLWMRKGFDERVNVRKAAGGFTSAVATIPIQPITRFSEGTISDSLFMTAEREGVPPGVIVEMIRMYSFDVDWEREIRPGDSFEVYFARSLNTEFGDLRDDHIISAKLTIQNGNNPDRVLELNRFKDSTGKVDYYTDEGKSARKALMKTPIDGAVLTSRFNPNRKHPVLGYTRAHKGSDFRARVGTPIMASGDGVVERADRYGSYGNYIRIRHNGTYKTAYAHLSKFGKGIRKGVRVKQGQIIGYAGATGRVSGPHLHYEVLVNGKHVDPMKLKLPTGKTLKGKDLKAFKAHIAIMAKEREASKNAIEALEVIRVENESDTQIAAISTPKRK